MSKPEAVDAETWLRARRELLAEEKELTRRTDLVNARRRVLPMVRIDKDYRFTGPDGMVGLRELFGDHSQLIVQHFMFDPSWDEGCGSCSAMVHGAATQGLLEQLAGRATGFVAVSRAPIEKLTAVRQARGWDFPWVSSYDNDFNYDFHVTLDPSRAPAMYNFHDVAELGDDMEWMTTYVGEQPGISVFLRDGDEIFHHYSTYGRGVEVMLPAYRLLDITPLGRQEPWERPEGRAPVQFRHDRGVLSADRAGS